MFPNYTLRELRIVSVYYVIYLKDEKGESNISFNIIVHTTNYAQLLESCVHVLISFKSSKVSGKKNAEMSNVEDCNKCHRMWFGWNLG